MLRPPCPQESWSPLQFVSREPLKEVPSWSPIHKTISGIGAISLLNFKIWEISHRRLITFVQHSVTLGMRNCLLYLGFFFFFDIWIYPVPRMLKSGWPTLLLQLFTSLGGKFCFPEPSGLDSDQCLSVVCVCVEGVSQHLQNGGHGNDSKKYMGLSCENKFAIFIWL